MPDLLAQAVPLALLLEQAAKGISYELRGRADTAVSGVGTLSGGNASQLGFLANPRYSAELSQSRLAAICVAETSLAGRSLPSACLIVTPQPYLLYARLATAMQRLTQSSLEGPSIHPSAVIHPSASIGQGVRIGPLCSIDADAVLEDGVQLAAGVVIGSAVRIGAHSLLHARSVVGPACRLGERVILQSGAVIGADGFGFAPRPAALGEGWEKIPQLGAVVLGHDVEIGANSCVDRGAIDDTVIGNGVKIDNLVQIAHNVVVGEHTAMAGCVGVAGSARIGARCTLGGGAIVLGHLSIADDVHISAASLVSSSIRKAGRYTGVFPLDEHAGWERNAAGIRQLAAWRKRLKALEQHHAAVTGPGDSD
jgi:UDP-3-O-[3-hydroxymyristoyl] glucosamine N-acyltransferase